MSWSVAVAAYRRAAQLDERDPGFLEEPPKLLAADGDLDEASAAAQEAYRLDETNPYVAEQALGALYLRKGRRRTGGDLTAGGGARGVRWGC